MSCEPYLLHNAIDGVFLPRSPVPQPQRFCLPRSRGVPTSFYKLNMMFLTNRGTPEYYFPYTQIRAVAHILKYIYIYTYYVCLQISLVYGRHRLLTCKYITFRSRIFLWLNFNFLTYVYSCVLSHKHIFIYFQDCLDSLFKWYEKIWRNCVLIIEVFCYFWLGNSANPQSSPSSPLVGRYLDSGCHKARSATTGHHS